MGKGPAAQYKAGFGTITAVVRREGAGSLYSREKGGCGLWKGGCRPQGSHRDGCSGTAALTALVPTSLQRHSRGCSRFPSRVSAREWSP